MDKNAAKKKYFCHAGCRVADVTGLNMETSEELQVSNYGIGGHYEPHFDFARVGLRLGGEGGGIDLTNFSIPLILSCP